MKKNETIKLVVAGLLAAIGVVLPRLILMLPLQGIVSVIVPRVRNVGAVLLPMHLPILICGFLCGYKYGFLCGFLVPFLASLFNGKPTFIDAISMAFELATYGGVCGILMMKKKKYPLVVSLIIAMLLGRLVMGISKIIIYGLEGNSYGIQMYLASAFVQAWPGIILQLILVPLIVTAVKKSNVFREEL